MRSVMKESTGYKELIGIYKSMICDILALFGKSEYITGVSNDTMIPMLQY